MLTKPADHLSPAPDENKLGHEFFERRRDVIRGLLQQLLRA
jgi:hypothetical protein